MSGDVIAVVKLPGGVVAITDDDQNMMTWPTKEAAKEALKDHRLVQAYGAHIFHLDDDGDLI